MTTADWFSCGLGTNGTITCWGDLSGASGDPPSGVFTAVDSGWTHSCALRSNGTVICWGNSDDGQSTAPTGQFTAVEAGFHHSCGLRTSGTVACWGNNDHGQSTATQRAIHRNLRPAPGIRAGAWPTDPSRAGAAARLVKRTYRLGSSALSLLEAGIHVCWELTVRLPAGDTICKVKQNPPSGEFAAIAAGNELSCGVGTDGGIRCWGADHTQRLRGQFNAIGASSRHVCGVRTDNTIACAGVWGGAGQSDALAGQFTAVAGGSLHSCGLRHEWHHRLLGQG